MHAFRADDVLQENIILRVRKAGANRTVGISTSEGIADLFRSKTYRLPVSRVLFWSRNDVIFRLPINDLENAILEIVDRWPESLHKYGMQISTGPVVPFRAKELIPTNRSRRQNLVPLLWMQNVRPMEIKWPLDGNSTGKEKRQFIKNNGVARRRKLLVSNTSLVLLRRFSAKEQRRRLTAAPLLKKQLRYALIGLENHLNYIYRLRSSLTDVEAFGLSALLNSSLLDRYFRISNGNTQVSATELRAMPFPRLSVLTKLGKRIKRLSRVPTLEEIDAVVEETLGVNKEILGRR